MQQPDPAKEWECPIYGVQFVAPWDMWPHVRALFAGEYDVPGLTFDTPPRVLDIGANVGAFAVWAMQRWPGATVTCYEPNPAAIAYLERNVASGVRPFAVVGSHAESVWMGRLRLGKNNLGEASFYDIGEQGEPTVNVETLTADTLEACDILKVDTEGCEVEIVAGYIHAHVTAPPRAVLFEFHRAKDRVALDRLLDAYGYTLAQGRVSSPERGTLCYVRSP